GGGQRRTCRCLGGRGGRPRRGQRGNLGPSSRGGRNVGHRGRSGNPHPLSRNRVGSRVSLGLQVGSTQR
ncbi:hypothetical protein RZS08_30505, partial [Arthrospira platensis SPKY1]|nr:hypothetical protein [Arthrospira platensis SPKY1]